MFLAHFFVHKTAMEYRGVRARYEAIPHHSPPMHLHGFSNGRTENTNISTRYQIVTHSRRRTMLHNRHAHDSLSNFTTRLTKSAHVTHSSTGQVRLCICAVSVRPKLNPTPFRERCVFRAHPSDTVALLFCINVGTNVRMVD